MIDKLIRILDKSFAEQYEKRGLLTAQHTAKDLLANGVIAPPCKVGDTVYYLNTMSKIALYKNTIYEAKVVRIVTTNLGTALVIQIRDEFGCCEISDIRDWGKTIFLTKEEAGAKLKEREKNDT